MIKGPFPEGMWEVANRISGYIMLGIIFFLLILLLLN